MITIDTVQLDARKFGVLLRTGWRMGLLVARSVERSQPGSKIGTHDPIMKISAQEFARLAGTSHHRVLRHLDAWEDAAMEGHVPHAVDLTPGQEVSLDAENLPTWDEFYDRHLPSRNPNPNHNRHRPISQEEWDQAEKLVRQGMSLHEAARTIGRGRTTLTRDPRLRAIKAEVDPEFAAETSQRNYEATIACNIEPASDFIRDIGRDVERLLGPVYTLTRRDLETVQKILTDALHNIERQLGS